MDFINLILTIVILTNLMLVVVLLVGNKEENKHSLIYKTYLVNILMIVWWVASMAFYRIVQPDYIIIFTKNLYISATFIASSFYYFILIFTHQPNKHIKKLRVALTINLLLVLAIAFTKFIITGAEVSERGENITFLGQYYFVYVLYILYFFCVSLFRVYREYRIMSHIDIRKFQYFLIFIGYTASCSIAFVTNILMPSISYFEYNWIGQVAVIIYALSSTYAVKKYKLFDVKIISIELFIFVLWIFTLLRTFTSENNINEYTSIIFLLSVFLIGVLLLNSIKKEACRFEQNVRLIKSLEIANLKLKEVDDMKTRFVSLATHHMASPLTTIKGYISLLKEDRSELNHQNLQTIEHVIEDFVTIVKDFLDVSQIERGQSLINPEYFDLKQSLSAIINEQEFLLGYKNIKIEGISEWPDSIVVNKDKAKITQAFKNILENSIRFCKDGMIKIVLVKDTHNICIDISDNGVRSLPNVPDVLLRKFSPTGDIIEANIMGKGLGVYVSKQLIEVQGGAFKISYDETNKVYNFNIRFAV